MSEVLGESFIRLQTYNTSAVFPEVGPVLLMSVTSISQNVFHF